MLLGPVGSPRVGVPLPDAVPSVPLIASFGRASDIQVAPDWNANVHVHLVPAVDALCVEYLAPEEGIFNFESLVTERLQVRDGALVLPQTPGVGLAFDAEALERYRV